MQINDLFGRAAAFETARLPDGTAAVLPAEHAAALYVNEQPAFRVVCTPELLPQLALGRLLTEGWITSAQEVEQAAVCAEGLKVNVYLNHRLTACSAAAQAVSSCCTDNVTLSSPVELPLLRTGFRMVVFSVVIMLIVLFYRQGIMGTREFSWQGIIDFFKKLFTKRERKAAKDNA